MVFAGFQVGLLIEVFFFIDLLRGPDKDGKVCIAGAPGLVNSLKIVAGEEYMKDQEDDAYF